MHPLLSARQEQCLRLTAFRTDKEIAAHLGISEATVKKHVHEACQRLKVNRRKAALALLDPIVPDQGKTSLSSGPSGYPKHPMARAAAEDHVPLNDGSIAGQGNDDTSNGQRGVASATGFAPGPEDDRSGVRLGYRGPPGNPILRIVLVVVMTLILAALVVTVVVMLGDMHEAVGKIDTASTAG